MSANGWVKRHRDAAGPVRLVAYSIPAVGAGAGTHRELAHAVDKDIDLLTLRLPGRETRRREAPLTTVAECVADLAPRLADHAAEHGLPFVVFGDCATSLLAYETGRALERAGVAVPVAVVSVNCRAPRHAFMQQQRRLASSEDLRAEAAKCATVPPEIAADAEVFALFEATVRADLTACEGYQWDGSPLATVPIRALVPAWCIDLDEFTAWREATRGGAELVPVTSEAKPPEELLSVLAQLRDSSNPARDPDLATQVGEWVTTAWVDLLPESRGSDSEAFFDVGGDSIAAVRLRNLLAEDLSSPPPLEEILSGATLGELKNLAIQRAQLDEQSRREPLSNGEQS